jgi:hypothetical protein
MRGEEGELNPWQVPVGQATPGILQTMGVHVLRAENPGELASLVSLGLTEAFEEEAAVAALISQSLIGIKSFLEGGKPTTPPKGGRPVTAGALSVPRFAGRRPGGRPGEEDPGPARTPEGVLHRRQVVATLLEDRGDLLVVAGLGAAAWDCTAAGDHPLTFPFWGGMGLAAVAGLGLALAQPRRRILVVTGDGELLMGLGSLATVAVQRPDNLTIVVLDNGRYGETGMQETHTAHGVDLASVAAACGFRRTSTISAMEEVADLRATIHNGRGPILSVVKVIPEELPLALPPRDGTLLKARFRDALFSPRTPSHPSPPRTPGGRDAE